jgi:hypothetical protein
VVKLLFEASAPVRAPVEAVKGVIDGDWLLGSLLSEEARSYVDVDRMPGTLRIQGHWWYRGEISAEEAPGSGTRLVQRVFNIARRGAWAVPLANRLFIGYRPQLQHATEELARRIEQHLAAAS